MLRIAHITDLHFYLFPRLHRALGKRSLGLANLYVGGRRHHFSIESVRSLVADLLEEELDLVVCTGDISALGHAPEFEAARKMLQPLLDRFPFATIPGNHDIYTRDAHRNRTMERSFGAWMAGGTLRASDRSWSDAPTGPVQWPVRFRAPGVELIGVNPCKPGIQADGFLPPAQLEALAELLAAPREPETCRLLLTHYPLLQSDGLPYRRGGHAMNNVDDVIEVVRAAPPDAILHGHHHGWFVTALEAQGEGAPVVPILNCGTSGWSYHGPERTAGWLDIRIDEGRLIQVERHALGEAGWSNQGRVWPPVQRAS